MDLGGSISRPAEGEASTDVARLGEEGRGDEDVRMDETTYLPTPRSRTCVPTPTPDGAPAADGPPTSRDGPLPEYILRSGAHMRFLGGDAHFFLGAGLCGSFLVPRRRAWNGGDRSTDTGWKGRRGIGF